MATTEMAESRREDAADGAVARFREHVVGPLARDGMRKPRRYTVAEWNEALDGLAREFEALSVAELKRLRAEIAANGAGAKGVTWPTVQAVRGLARKATVAHMRETGGTAALDREIAARAVSFWRRHGELPARLFRFTRRSVIVEILRAPEGPTVADLRRDGHPVDDDLADAFAPGGAVHAG